MTTFVYILLVIRFLGLEWEGQYFTYSTLLFGWKASAYLYHSIGLAATCYVRSLGVPCSQYVDDRHNGQLRLPHSQLLPSFSGFQLAEMAVYFACVTSISLGYFIGIKKSCLIPSVAVSILSYICHSEKQTFLLPQEKRDKFAALRENILSHKTVSLKNIQKFAGNTTSFALLVPAAKFFTDTTSVSNHFSAPVAVQKCRSGQIRQPHSAVSRIGAQVIPAKPLYIAFLISELTADSVTNNTVIFSVNTHSSCQGAKIQEGNSLLLFTPKNFDLSVVAVIRIADHFK